MGLFDEVYGLFGRYSDQMMWLHDHFEDEDSFISAREYAEILSYLYEMEEEEEEYERERLRELDEEEDE